MTWAENRTFAATDRPLLEKLQGVRGSVPGTARTLAPSIPCLFIRRPASDPTHSSVHPFIQSTASSLPVMSAAHPSVMRTSQPLPTPATQASLVPYASGSQSNSATRPPTSVLGLRNGARNIHLIHSDRPPLYYY